MAQQGPSEEYSHFNVEVGGSASIFLERLCFDMADQAVDMHGWTEHDYSALDYLEEVHFPSRAIVPPETTSTEDRLKCSRLLTSLWSALPFAEAERLWLLEGSKPTEPGMGSYAEIRASEATLVSDGITRVIHGRDLMHRWWLWRRELDAYSDGAGLHQARESLAGITKLLTPGLGLPESYTKLGTTA